MDRKSYWNEKYVQYWKAVTEEANDKSSSESHVKKLHSGDSKTAGEEVVFHTLDTMQYQEGEKLLDYGCGFGRLYPFFCSKRIDYYGIDISEAMIEECKKKFPDNSSRFSVAEGEMLPFPDSEFSKIVCYGVFDACYQEQALAEMFRVLKSGGELLITGKNTNYFEDDEQAYIAEEAARAKGHPNYFTDCKRMIGFIDSAGSSVVSKRFFLYRGDTGKEKFVELMPEQFYEWQLVVRKNSEMKQFQKFSDAYSETWKKKSK